MITYLPTQKKTLKKLKMIPPRKTHMKLKMMPPRKTLKKLMMMPPKMTPAKRPTLNMNKMLQTKKMCTSNPATRT